MRQISINPLEEPMKKLVLLLFVAILLTACGPAPQDVANSWQEALNKGDIDAALSFLSEDAVVTISPAGPEGDAVFTGHTEIRGWYETIKTGKGITTLSNCKVDGETVTCLDTYADEGLKSMGVDFIEGEWKAAVRDGKILLYTFTTTPESLAKLAPPPEPTLSAPVEALAGSIDDLVGVWWFPKMGMIEVKADGTSRCTINGEIAAEGNYTFDNGKVTWVSRSSCGAATYEAYVARQDGKPIWLRMQVIGSDPCRDRANAFSTTGKFQNP